MPSPRSLLVSAVALLGGLLAAGVLSTAVPAAPEQCLPVVGCVTTSVPPVTVPTVTVPPLPIATAPSTTTTTTTTTTAGTSGSDSGDASAGTSGGTPATSPAGAQAALSANALVRVRGTGARRVIEIRLVVTRAAGVSALLERNRRALTQRQYAVRAGSSVLRLPVRRSTKAGPARLRLTYRTNAGETVRASYRLRLPR